MKLRSILLMIILPALLFRASFVQAHVNGGVPHSHDWPTIILAVGVMVLILLATVFFPKIVDHKIRDLQNGVNRD